MILKHHIAMKNLKNDDTSEYDMTANAYSNHYTGFRIKSGMTGGISLSSLSGGSSSELSLDDIPSLSSLGDHFLPLSSLGKSRRDATRGSINNDINILDSRVFADATHKNDSRMSESGRSMVEMLGTLAIIGVLSVGAIGGYSYGMDKYRANTIMNDVMLRSVDVIAQFDRTGDASLDSWPNACGIRLSFNRIPDWRQV